MKYSLDELNRLSQIQEDNDIKSLSYAIFPGTHCPLFGVTLTASYIKNMAVIVVGTGECTYYTKNFAYHRQKGLDHVYSLVLKEQDIVFGAGKKVKEAVSQIIKDEEGIEAAMIVSTCVPELIGEDYGSLKGALKEELGIPVFSVQTEHFKCNSHIPGMTRALTALVEVMEKSEVKEGINILGHRDIGIEQTELMKLIVKHNYQVNTVIPSKCTLESLRQASKAKINIVTDHIALDLAKAMEERFGVPYVYFSKHMNKERIYACYTRLEALLDISFTELLKDERATYDELFETCQKLVRGKKLVYGNTPMMAFETVDFLAELGMEPIFVQVRELYKEDEIYRAQLLERGYDPYISRIANIAPLRELYDVMGGDIYVGHENPMLLRQKGLQQITFESEAQKIGYELPIGIMRHLIHLMSSKSVGMEGRIHHGNL